MQFLALIRALAHHYRISSEWARAFRFATLGAPAIRKPAPDQSAPSAALEACKAAGRFLVKHPAEALRGLILGVEEGMHDVDSTVVMKDSTVE